MNETSDHLENLLSQEPQDLLSHKNQLPSTNQKPLSLLEPSHPSNRQINFEEKSLQSGLVDDDLLLNPREVALRTLNPSRSDSPISGPTPRPKDPPTRPPIPTSPPSSNKASHVTIHRTNPSRLPGDR